MKARRSLLIGDYMTNMPYHRIDSNSYDYLDDRKNNRVLFIAPYFDEATKSSSMTVEIAEEIFNSNDSWEIWELEVDSAVRSNFETVIKNYGPFDLVFFGGHGDQLGWIGQLPLYSYSLSKLARNDYIMDIDNAKLLSNTIVVSIACLVGRLAPSIINLGCRTFIGSTDFIYVGYSYEGVKNYEADFIRSFESIPLSLIRGYTVSEALDYFSNVCLTYEQEYEDKQYKYYDTFKENMVRNREGISAYGDVDASIIIN